jgi:hypothetical protein
MKYKARAYFKSVKSNDKIDIFRFNTELYSEQGPGKPIGLVYMMNPGKARPESDEIFNKLEIGEFETPDFVSVKTDNTMNTVMSFLQAAYSQEGIRLPERYTIHIENLFNVREHDSNKARKMIKASTLSKDIMYKKRNIDSKDYSFVWLAWGKLNIEKSYQDEMIKRFPKAIMVNKRNYKGKVLNVNYPIHPGRMNKGYFLEAAKGKIRSELISY